MTDAWGIDDRHHDTAGHEHVADPDTVERLRAAIGEPAREPVTIVRRVGDATPLPPGSVETEHGAEVADPADLPIGYHRLHAPDGSERRVIVAPPACHLPADLRAWGWSAQLYALRSARSWGIGDLGDLRRLTEIARRQGAGFVLINPIGAVHPTDDPQPSPYYPASRLFRNPLHLDVDAVAGSERVSGVAAEGAAARRLLADRHIDRAAVWRHKRTALELLWADRPGSDGFDAWFDRQADLLHRFARWSVLVERLGPDWRTWPDAARRPTAASDDVDPDRVRFHAWIQWLLEQQLQEAAAGVALMQDLPIGVDPSGFDAWLWQDVFAEDVSVGAPPDAFNQDGQDWGLPPMIPARLDEHGYEPFVQAIRSHMTAGGALRIDHVMGLSRLWWIPSGHEPRRGAYVRSDAEALFAILALESHRAGALVVGEDLGTVEDGVREAMAANDVLSYRLLWFEPRPPTEWPVRAMAAVTTHDLPTVTGFWDGSDAAELRALGLDPNDEGSAEIRRRVGDQAGLGPEAAAAEAVVAVHRALADAPSMLVAATVDDALAEPRRPNVPGIGSGRDNWCWALPTLLDDFEDDPLVAAVVAAFGDRSSP